MSNLERRLVGSFNIELVVESINVKISDGIMNFQENSGQVSTKVSLFIMLKLILLSYFFSA